MITIRAATESDCIDLHRVHMAAARSLPSSARGQGEIDEWLSSRVPSQYAQEIKTDYCVIAEEGDQVFGWGALNVGKKEITNVFVDPEHHRKRIGTLIVAELERSAREAGVDVLQLRATGTAIGFYLNNGFQSDPPVALGAEWALMKKVL